MRRPAAQARRRRAAAGQGGGPAPGEGGRAAYSGVVPAADPPPTATPEGPETAGFLRRLGAVVVDWLLCQGIALLFTGTQGGGGGAAAFLPLAIFAAMNLLFIALTGSTVGHRLFGMQVWQVRPGSFPLQVLVRTVLLCLFVPAVLTARDGRGLHDVLAGTRIVRL
jgi:uncharacterized RDD family membrane protein YckC